MTKREVLNAFWTKFDIPAWDEGTVPVKAEMPYITYESRFDSFGSNLALTGSLWYRSTSWSDIEQKAVEIENMLGRGGVQIPYTGGCVWIRKSSPFEQRMIVQEDADVRRIVINISAEFISE